MAEIDSHKLTVLCVDDETNILRAQKRLLHNKNYNVLLADSGEAALDILAKHDVHVVVSDMKMPGMTGSVLMEKIANLYPKTYRIILTGFADFQSTLDAVNLGKIHRYLQKPWENNDFINTIEEGLQQIMLEKSYEKLSEKAQQQNEELKELNNKLEELVSLRTKQIRAAMKKIEQHNLATESMLFNFIAINPNLDGNFAKKVSEIAVSLAKSIPLNKEGIQNTRLAGLLSDIGLLGLESKLYKVPFSELNYEQQKVFYNQVETTKAIMSPAPHLQTITDILVHQFDTITKLFEVKLATSQDVVTGTKIQAIAYDYCRYAFGRMTKEHLNKDKIFIEMNKAKGVRYDPDILDLLIKNPDLVDVESKMQGLDVGQLKPGMYLAKSIFNEHHILILAEGHEFTEKSIEKLAQYERNHNIKLTAVIETQE